MNTLWSNKKLKKAFATATLAAFAAAGVALPAVPAYAADSTHITEAQKAQFSDSSWIQKQAQKEKDMEAKFQAGNYTAEAPYVEVDPYGNNPLSALVMFKTKDATKVSVTVEVPADKSGAYDAESTFSFNFDEYTTTHYVPVYALYDGQNTVTLTVTDKAGKTETYSVAVTAKVPDVYNVSANTIAMDKKSSTMKDGLNFVSYVFAGDAKVVAYDFNGNYRAIMTNAGQSKIYDLKNGHLAFEDNNVLHGLYYTSSFIEMDMMGKVYQKYLVNGIHHEFIKLENGNWLVDAELPNANTTEDYFVELDNKSGNIVRDWWLKDSMKMNKYEANPYYSYNKEDWAHVNSFVQIPGEDAIWYSARQNDGMYLLNLSTNKIDAIIAEDDADYADEIRNKRLTPVITQKDGSIISVDDWWKNNKELNPSGAAIDWHNPDDPYFQIENVPFEYTYGQHAVSLLPNGDIFVFDNGDGRSKDPDKMITGNDENVARNVMLNSTKGSKEYNEALATNYSRAVVYHYDLQKGTVEQLWQYGKERGMELYSMYICDVDYLGPDHYLIDFGGAREGFKDLSVLKENPMAAFTGGNPYARVIELYKGEVVSEMNVATNCYRAERLNPYFGTTGEYELNKVQGVQKGELLMDRAVLPGADTDAVKMKIGHAEYFTYNGSVDMDTAPYIDKNDRTMIPVRFAGKAIGAKTEWNADAKTVTVTEGDNKVVFTIGSNEMVVNGETQTIDTAAVIKDNRTMLPLRAAAEAIGATVSYDNGTITITK